MSDHVLFAVGPYLAAVSLVVAVAFGALAKRRKEPQSPSERTTVRELLGKHWALVIAPLGVLAGHVVIVAWPSQLLIETQELSRLIVFELTLFLLGLTALATLIALVVRRLRWQAPNGARLIDIAFLGVLLVTMLSGLAVAARYRWASAWSAVTLTPYVRSILSLQPDLQPLAAMPYLVKLHVFSSIVLVALVAFTRPIQALLSRVNRVVILALSPVTTVFSSRWRGLQERARRSGRHVMWSEEAE